MLTYKLSRSHLTPQENLGLNFNNQTTGVIYCLLSKTPIDLAKLNYVRSITETNNFG